MKIKSTVADMIKNIKDNATGFEVTKNEANTVGYQNVPESLVADQLTDELKEAGGLDTLRKFQDFRDQTLVPAMVHGLALEGAKMMAEEESLESVISTMMYGNDTMTFRQKRQQEVLAGAIKEGEERKTKTVYAKPSGFNYSVNAVADKGQLKAVKLEVNPLCEALLNDNK